MRQWIKLFTFVEDRSKEGRVLSAVKIGNVYMSRLIIEQAVITGNIYHKKTKVMFYAERGTVLATFEHIKTKERYRLVLESGKHVIHVPPLVAHSTKNIGRDSAVLIFFTNRRLRSGDDYSYIIQ